MLVMVLNFLVHCQMIPKLFQKIIELEGKQFTFRVSVSLYVGIFH